VKITRLKQGTILRCLLLLAILIVISVNFIFNNITEIVPFGYNLGQVMSNLSLSYIASFIFYLVVVIPKEKSDKKNIYGTIYNLTTLLIARAYSIFNDLIVETDIPFDRYDKKTILYKDYEYLCEHASRMAVLKHHFTGHPTNKRPTNRAELIYNNSFLAVKDYSDNILVFVPYLDSNYLNILNQLLNCFFYKYQGNDIISPFNNENFKAWAPEMFKYLEAVRTLDEYNEKKLKKYSAFDKKQP